MSSTMQLDQALESIPAYGFLCYEDGGRLELETLGRKVPISLRRAIVKHRSELEDLMQSGAAVVCPSTRLHRPYWRYNRRDKQYICEKCLELEQDIRMSREQQGRMAC